VVGRKVLLVWRVTKVVGMERTEEESPSSVSERLLLLAPMVVCGRLFLVPDMWE
jgi:hypothetical protein